MYTDPLKKTLGRHYTTEVQYRLNVFSFFNLKCGFVIVMVNFVNLTQNKIFIPSFKIQ